MKQRAGFTLIELLVVIAVIAVLMGILMPALSRARAQARMIKCQANLSQYAIAGKLYSNDWNFDFPYSFKWLYATGGSEPQLARCEHQPRSTPGAGRLHVEVSQGAWHSSVPRFRRHRPISRLPGNLGDRFKV